MTSESGAPRVDVVVVAYNSAEALRASLPAAQQIPGLAQLVVVDNGPDASSEVASQLGAEVLRRPGNPGFGTSQNAGVACGHAPFVLLLNPDAKAVAAAVTAGLDWLSTHDDVAAVQGVITNRVTGQPERSQGRELGPAHLLGRACGLRVLLRTKAEIGRAHV